jgi:dTDP-4-dehydrorhamnose 3,5-epimerase
LDSSNVVIIGVEGQLGKALASKFPLAKKLSHKDIDISNWDSLSNLDLSKAKVIVNAAAYTNVDKCETKEGRVRAWQVNAIGAGMITRLAEINDCTLVHISSDYVFDGTLNPHKEDEPFSPLGVYGQTKAAGDITVNMMREHFIIRTSWVIGEGKNFVRTMLELANKGIIPSVVSDQTGRPTFTNVLADGIYHLLASGAPYGTYNLSNEGEQTNWANLAREVFSRTGNGLNVKDVTSVEYFNDNPKAAPRPLNSTFDLKKIESTCFKPKDWQESLKEYLDKESK